MHEAPPLHPTRSYVVVTGGVASSIGKGVVAASIARLLTNRGVRVGMQKLDPYLNVDAGTMNPYQHGECFVTDDGFESDLDLGHYERFLGTSVDRNASVTTGQIYQSLLRKERAGDFLGETVQVVPHVTDALVDRMVTVAPEAECVVLELGGTIGDAEGWSFLEAVRQLRRMVGAHRLFHVHVVLVPTVGPWEEIKTKPAQHSVIALREHGLQPDAIVCRSHHEIWPEHREKIARFCDVAANQVYLLPDLPSIYHAPQVLEVQGVCDALGSILGLGGEETEQAAAWNAFVTGLESDRPTVKIGVVGKYVANGDAYRSIAESLVHAGVAENVNPELVWIEAEKLEETGTDHLADLHGMILCPGFGARGTEGKILAIKAAREEQIPFLGICYGMQLAVVETARSLCGWADAHTTEVNEKTGHPVIALLSEQAEVADKGASMRLGAYPAVLKAGSKAFAVYGKADISERHRHRYEFNNQMTEDLAKAGLVVSGTSPDGELVEIVERPDHPYFIGVQFHPEYQSRPTNPHPVFRGLIAAARKRAGL